MTIYMVWDHHLDSYEIKIKNFHPKHYQLLIVMLLEKELHVACLTMNLL
jgi:hypothetical protein